MGPTKVLWFSTKGKHLKLNSSILAWYEKKINKNPQQYTTLRLDNISTDDASTTDLLLFLNNHPQLTDFTYSNRKTLPTCSVLRCVATSARYITGIYIDMSNIPKKVGLDLMACLALPKCPVTSLHFCSVRMGVIVVRNLVAFIRTTTRLTSFMFRYCKSIPLEEARAMLDAIEANTSIESLIVSHSDIAEGRKRRFVYAALSNPKLTSFVFSSDSNTYCDLDFPRIQPTLKKLTLCVPLPKHAWKLLARVLKVTTTLTHVNLSGCCLGSEGVTAMLDAFRGDSTIESIELSCNNGYTIPDTLTALIVTAPSLVKLGTELSRSAWYYHRQTINEFKDAVRNHSNLTYLGYDHEIETFKCTKYLERNKHNRKRKGPTLFDIMIDRCYHHLIK